MNQAALVFGFAGIFAMARVMPAAHPRRLIALFLASAIVVAVLVSLPVPYAPWFGLAVWWSMAAVFFFIRRRSMARWTREAATHAIVLDAPFVGAWKAVAGGADPRRNHHLVASDQRFAYDFVRDDGDSFGSSIIAPIGGRVTFVENAMDDQPQQRKVHETRPAFGNCVAIETPDGTVMLCHLQRGSVRVAVGDTVDAGQEIGRCGNSGRTTRSHLHIHAQRELTPAPFSGTGVPIAFRVAGEPRILAAGDVIGGPVAMALGETPLLAGR